MKLLKNNSGFTLLEFITALVIIAILAGLATVSFNVYRQKNRDVKRITDIKDIQGSLEIYYRNNEMYPTNLEFGSAWSDGSMTYIDELPNNPTPRGDNGCPNTEYEYTPDYNNSSYHLTFCLGSPTADITSGIKVAIPSGEIIPGTSVDYNTKLLLHINNDVLDSSPSAKTMTNNSMTFADNIYKFGGYSGAFDGATSYLSVPDSADWDFGNNNFSVDFWIRYTVLPTAGNAEHSVGQWTLAPQLSFVCGLYNDTGVYKMRFVYSVDGTNAVATNGSLDAGIVADAWYHLAYVRSGNTLTFYVNGVAKGTVDLTGIAIYNSTSLLTVGAINGGSLVNGYMDEVRISKGIARWSSAFTPPTAEY